MVPASMARIPSRASSAFLLGASAPIPPIWIPMELKFANPHRAKVAIVKDRGSSVGLHRAQPLEGDQFVSDHPQAEQIADSVAVMPGNSDDPCDW